MKKKLSYIIGSALLIIAACIIGGGIFMVNFALSPENRGKDMETSMAYMRETYPQINEWIDSLQQHNALKDTFLTAPDGTPLHAFYARSSKPTAKTAVIIHGYTDNAIRMFHIGYLYNSSLDYNILLPDLRYSGLSGGKAIQMGWLDRLDVLQWLNTTPRIFGDSLRVVVHGISMGAATTMMLSGENLPDYVRCFVEDCGYTTVWDQFKKELHEQFGLPAFPLLYAASGICDLKYKWNFKEASSVTQIKKCTKPMFFIHGDQDFFVPTSMVYQLYDSKPQPKALWIVPKAGHADSYRLYPSEYTRRVKSFTETYLSNHSTEALR